MWLIPRLICFATSARRMSSASSRSSTPRASKASPVWSRISCPIHSNPLFEMMVNEVPAPVGDVTAPLQMLVTNLDYDEFKGRIALGRVRAGTMTKATNVKIGVPDKDLVMARSPKCSSTTTSSLGGRLRRRW